MWVTCKYVFDSIDMSLSHPLDKMENLYQLLNDFKLKKSATKRDLQKLCGHLNFASIVVKGGLTFFNRVLNLMNKLKRPYHRTRLRLPHGYFAFLDSIYEAFQWKSTVVMSRP